MVSDRNVTHHCEELCDQMSTRSLQFFRGPRYGGRA